jgi:membrane protease YdiL (CAAX protease family)
VALVSAAIGGALILAATGHTDAEDVPIGVIALLQATLWVGLLGAPIVAGRYRGNGVVRDFGLRGRPIDLLVGLGLGLVCQFLLVPLVSYPWVRLLGRDLDDVSTAARDLIDKATDPLGVALLVVIVVIGAPIIEELFFRGLVQRAVARRFGAGWAIAASSLLFGLAHFQTLQAPALVALGVVLGLLAHRNRRLGPGIATHMTFNAVTVVALLLA